MTQTPTNTGRPPLPARAALVSLIALGALALAAAPASAHSGMTGSDPADGSTVDVAPDSVTLSFNEPPQSLGTEIVVIGPDGSTVSEGATTVTDVTVSQPLGADRLAGAYSVQWRVTSADGHPLSGELAFTATDGTGSAQTTEPDLAPTHPEPTAGADLTPPAPAQTSTPSAAALDASDAPMSWQWGPTSVVVLVAIVVAAAGLTVLALRLRRRAAGDGAPSDTDEPA
ncbi:copper resistance CopC family protein [Cellulomonas hominis]|uniref:copper resistance CopC family protein n=1 Tax=Cellulomonas hominis TaxID=156981 RepID=UPI001B908493|nr:copper resistance CopC family protein [Cellulomonas hominis]VTR77194.1 Copper transport protein YcnJ [Cellulomonas hominis]